MIGQPDSGTKSVVVSGEDIHGVVEGNFFFFQAEDGIRDYKVTGVQTCALPILPGAPPHPAGDPSSCHEYACGVCSHHNGSWSGLSLFLMCCWCCCPGPFWLFVQIGRASCRERV